MNIIYLYEVVAANYYTELYFLVVASLCIQEETGEAELEPELHKVLGHLFVEVKVTIFFQLFCEYLVHAANRKLLLPNLVISFN